MIGKNWPTELRKISDAQASVIFRKRSRSSGGEPLRLSMRSLTGAEDVSSSSDNLSFIGLSSKNAGQSSSSPGGSSCKDNDQKSLKSSSKSPDTSGDAAVAVVPSKDAEKKEKKRKELSSSRTKKFFRHFPQVDPEEHVINYFSCALVSDILLQGHMYITANYFAFYSNVFGFVTKLLIPVVSVERISKEKTAKIIPNAIGVATANERHVFGSFMSREAAYRLMLSVWRPTDVPETPTSEAAKSPVELPVDVEISECSIEDDSSCSVSGNESSANAKGEGVGEENQLRQRVPPVGAASSGVMETSTTSSGVTSGDVVDGSPLRLKVSMDTATHRLNGVVPEAASRRSGRKESRVTWLRSRVQQINLKFPTDIHIVYLGVILAIILALFSGFLLYRIMDIQARANRLDYNWKPNRELDVYEEVLKWQREIQERSVEETQNILSINLEQILKVRKSLESLSSFLHGKRDSNTAKTLDGGSSLKT